MAEQAILAPGTVLADRYRIEARVGEGTVAVVYRASHTTLARRKYAVKVLRAALDLHQKARDGFFHEAETVSHITHPNIVGVHDIVRGEGDGPSYIVMDYVDGETAFARMKRVRMPPREAMGIVADVLAGLAAAHARGIIHRDIKPENILLVQGADGRVERAVLADFGLAHFRPDEDPDAPQMTAVVTGTLVYMSPEAKNGGSRVDKRSDLFSVGATLWALLTGRAPSAIEVLKMKKDMQTGIPPAVLPIIIRAVEAYQDERYQTAEEMLHDVLQVQGALPKDTPPPESVAAGASDPPRDPPRVTNPPEIPIEQPRATFRGRRSAFQGRTVNWRALAGVLAVVVVAVGVGAWWLRTLAAEPVAVDPPVVDATEAVEAPVVAAQAAAPERVEVPIVTPVVEQPTDPVVQTAHKPKRALAAGASDPPRDPPRAEDTAPRIVHNAPATAVAESTVTVTATAFHAAPTTVTLRYRQIGGSGFQSAAMRPADGGFRATITVPSGGVEYFIDGTLADGSVLKDGSRTSLYRITTP